MILKPNMNHSMIISEIKLIERKNRFRQANVNEESNCSQSLINY